MQDGHPERPERLSALMAHLDHCGLLQDLDVLEPQEATTAHLSLVHKNSYLTQLNEISPQIGLVNLNPDMAIGPNSLKSARLSVGAALQGLPACNGWTFWHIKRSGRLVPIDNSRTIIRSSA